MKMPATEVRLEDDDRGRLTKAGTDNEGIDLEIVGIRTSLLLVRDRVISQFGVEFLVNGNWFAHLVVFSV